VSARADVAPSCSASRLQVPCVGPLQIDFQDRCCFVGALVLGDVMLIGSVPMEDVDLVVNPDLQRLEADPRSPHLPYRSGLKLALRLGSTGQPQQQKKRPLGTARRVRWWRGGRDQAEPTPT